jgi:tRNA (cytidine/uridine-2'-O-)-methyltransferase
MMIKVNEMQCDENLKEYKSGKSKKGFSAEVVLFEPEIPQNTGNIARTCAALGCRLHLIEPLGFSLEDKYLRRAGLDYWHLVEVICYPNMETFFTVHRDGRFFFLTKHARRIFYDADLQDEMPMYFFFGRETIGLPPFLLAQYPDDCYRLPMRSQARSLNISNAAAVVLYEAFRQNNFPHLQNISASR